MGTNYYWHAENDGSCQHCGRGGAEPLHIGKSSMGWTFSFHAVDDPPLRSFDAWVHFMQSTRGRIVNEYGETVSLQDFIDLVKQKAERSKTLNHTIESGRLGWGDRCFLDKDGHSFSEGKFS